MIFYNNNNQITNFDAIIMSHQAEAFVQHLQRKMDESYRIPGKSYPIPTGIIYEGGETRIAHLSDDPSVEMDSKLLKINLIRFMKEKNCQLDTMMDEWKLHT